MGKITVNVGGKPSVIPFDGPATPEAVAGALRTVFPDDEIKFPQNADEVDDATPIAATPPATDEQGAPSFVRLGKRLAQNFPAPVQPFVQAGAERFIEPAARLAGIEPGGEGFANRASDVLSVGSSIATPGLALAGAGVQGVTNALGMSDDMARAAGGVTELLSSLAKVGIKSTQAAMRAGKQLTGAERAIQALPQADDYLPMERISRELTTALDREFRARKAVLQPALNALEVETVMKAPKILPGTSAYNKLDEAVQYVNDSAAQAGSVHADGIMGRIANALANDEPINTKDVQRLRKIMKDRADIGRTADPAAASEAKKAAAIRNKLTDALENTMDEDLLGRWRETTSAWGTQVSEPLSVLHDIIETKTPAQAFQKVFQNSDPETFRTVLRVANTTPSVAGKLRLGFLDVLRENTNDFGDARKMKVILDQLTPMISSSGLFKPDELRDLSVLVARKGIVPISTAIGSMFTSVSGGLRLGAGLATASALTSNPMGLIIAAAAAGALPSMRKLTVLPAGSPAARQAATQVMNQVMRFASAVNADQAQPRQPGESAQP